MEDLRESVIITEVGLDGVGDVMGWCTALTVGVVIGVGGWFAALEVGVVLVGEFGLSVVELSGLLGRESVLNLPYLSQMGRALMWVGWSESESGLSLLLLGSLLLLSLFLASGLERGEMSCDIQSKWLMMGDGVGAAAYICQRVGLVGRGRGDNSGEGFVVVVGGVVGEEIVVVMVLVEVVDGGGDCCSWCSA